MRPNKLSRRGLLRGAGGIAVALPFLESLGSARAGGMPSTPRYLQFMHVQGTISNEWAPSGTAASPVLSNILSPLEPMLDSILVVSGCENRAQSAWGSSNGHISNGRSILASQGPGASELASGPSIDQVIAGRIQGSAPYRSLQFGIGGAGVGEYQTLMAGPSDPVPLDGNPVQIFDQLFSDLSTEPTTEPSALDRIRAQRTSVLDAVADSLDSTRARLSAADRIVLERHATKIRELEQSLGGGGGQGGGATLDCGATTLNLPRNYDNNNGNLGDISSRTMIDLMVMALACDLTRVGTLQYTDYHGPSFPWLNLDIPGQFSEWHAMVHELDSIDKTVPRAVYRWYMEEYAYLLEQLASVNDGDGSLLDHMLVMSFSEMGHPQHTPWDIPVVLAGGLDGAFTTGRHLQAKGAGLANLFTSFLNMLGQDDQIFGDPAFCDGPLNLG